MSLRAEYSSREPERSRARQLTRGYREEHKLENGAARDLNKAVSARAAAGGMRNAPVRAEALQQMQRTYGNRAVQRTVSVQRTPEGPNWADVFDESKLYDPPTPEEMAKLEEMYQKGLRPEAGDTLSKGLRSPLMKYGGGALGILGGALGIYGGGKEVVDAADDSGGFLSDVGDIVHGGLEMGAGGASALGGIGMMTGSTSLLATGEAGLVLGAGLLGYKAGEAIGEYGIDRYLNRPHMEDVADIDENYQDSWAYKINSLLED